MTPMWESVEPSLVRGGALRWRTLKLLGIGESAVEEKLAELVRSTSPTVATYAKNDGVHVRVADKASTPEEADRRVAGMEHEIRARLGEYVWGRFSGRMQNSSASISLRKARWSQTWFPL